MSRKSPRFVPSHDETLVEITASVVGHRFLLTPSEELNAGILAALGRALSLYPVALHAISFMSNHWHGMVTVPDAKALTEFVQHLHSNVARLVHRLHGWDGSVFGKAALIVIGATAEETRLKYILAQGVKEGLVRRCVDWPGIHSARALLLEEALVGRWRDRRAERRIQDGGGQGGGRAPLAAEVETRYPIELAPLPTWRELDTGERLRRVRRLVNEIETAARAAYPSVLGVRGVLARDPFSKPKESKRGSAPPIHTASEEERSEFAMAEAAFSQSFHIAKHELRGGKPASVPAGCFPPTTPFRTSHSTIWVAREETPLEQPRTGDNEGRTPTS